MTACARQGDILWLEKEKQYVLVLSRDFFNQSGMSVVCPLRERADPDALHIRIHYNPRDTTSIGAAAPHGRGGTRSFFFPRKSAYLLSRFLLSSDLQDPAGRIRIRDQPVDIAPADGQLRDMGLMAAADNGQAVFGFKDPVKRHSHDLSVQGDVRH